VATRQQPAPRRTRERELVLATRALFDERGMLDAPIEEIARSVGIARGLIYRQFSSKEELFVLTVTDYLAELAAELEEVDDTEADPAVRLESSTRAYARFCQRYPAFLDSALSLMKRPARELQEIVSESIWLRLGQGMSRCVDPLVEVVRAGAESGRFHVEDPVYMANVLWTQVLGAMHLARIGVGISEAAPGIPQLFKVTPEQVVETCVESALATVGVRP
jgi:AcrR family transcriptional regulator